jgi:hypothetical protein
MEEKKIRTKVQITAIGNIWQDITVEGDLDYLKNRITAPPGVYREDLPQYIEIGPDIEGRTFYMAPDKVICIIFFPIKYTEVDE